MACASRYSAASSTTFSRPPRSATPIAAVFGLGLGIVRRLSRMLELPVEVSSAIGVGTRFTIDITSIVCARTDLPHAATAAPGALRRGQRVLLVEDEQAMRLALRTYLELDDHEVFLAGSLQELDQVLGTLKQPPDIVVSDSHLGASERGTDAIDRIRVRFGNHIPAIVLTGDTSLIPARLGEQPATRMLNKPVDIELLTATMEELLRAH